MRHHRDDVVARALRVLDDHGLADLTMRRLGTELGVQPSALYHHFANKQALLAAVADEILVPGRASAAVVPEGPGTTGCAPPATRCATPAWPGPTAPRWSRPRARSGWAPARRTTSWWGC